MVKRNNIIKLINKSNLNQTRRENQIIAIVAQAVATVVLQILIAVVLKAVALLPKEWQKRNSKVN